MLRVLEARYPLTQVGIPEDDTMVQLIVEILGGHDDQVAQFFAAYIHGTQELDYAQLCDVVGLHPRWHTGDDGALTLGIRVKNDGNRLVVASVTPDSPAAQAGIAPFDEIIAVNAARIDAARFKARLHECAPGSTVQLSYFRRDELRTVAVAVVETPLHTITLQPSLSATTVQRARYAQWLCVSPA